MRMPGKELPTAADVVIIGGGVIGTVTAYILAKSGAKVVLVERHDVGAGTTSSAAAAALLQTKTSAKKLSLANHSLKLLDRLHDQLEHRFEYAHTGSLLAATTEDEMQYVQDMYQKLHSLGLNVELLDGQAARQVMPILGQAVVGGSYSPNDAQINPLELVSVCMHAAEQCGAHFATFCEVTGIEKDGEAIKSVQTGAGRIQTGTVINAAGLWAPDIAQFAGTSVSVTPLKGELLVTERMPPQMKGTLIAAKYLLSKSRAEGESGGRVPKRSVGITLVQVAHGNFVVGSTREQAGYDKSSTFGGIYDLVSQLLDLAPSLAECRLLRGYAGLRPLTPDGSPIISRTPGLPGLIQAVGFGGDGLAMSAITADLILGLINGDADPHLVETFSINRFSVPEINQ